MTYRLRNLKKLSMKLFWIYQAGILTLEEYIHFVTPIDKEIDKLEMQFLLCGKDSKFLTE